jgi:hypothetical protein
MRYEVKKMQHGNGGKLFSYPAKRFGTIQEAEQYADDFATDQRDVPGTIIVLKERKGDRTLVSYTCGRKSDFRGS